jgi:hypothetical protein
MVLRMARPTRRDNSSFHQFKKRTPAKVLAKFKGQQVLVSLPAADNHPPKVVRAKLGEYVKFSLQTRDETVARLRNAAATQQLEEMWAGLLAGPRDRPSHCE